MCKRLSLRMLEVASKTAGAYLLQDQRSVRQASKLCALIHIPISHDIKNIKSTAFGYCFWQKRAIFAA